MGKKIRSKAVTHALPPLVSVDVEKMVKDSHQAQIRKDRRSRGEASREFWQNLIPPPVSFTDILNLTNCSAYHQAAIETKAGVSVGLGFEASDAVKAFLQEAIREEEPFQFLLKIAKDLETFGNLAIEVATDRAGRIREIYHVPAHTLVVQRVSPMAVRWVQFHAHGYTPLDAWLPAAPVRFGNAIIHAKFYSPLSHFYGMPEWLAALEALRLERNVKVWHSAFFANGAIPSLAMILKGGEFSDDTAEEIKTALEQTKGGENGHRTLIIELPDREMELQLERLMPEQRDMSFESLYRATREEILTAHQVPARIAGISVTTALGGGSETAAQLKVFREVVIEKRQNLIESVIHRILRGAGIEPEFELRELDLTEDVAEEPQGVAADAGLAARLMRIEKRLL